MSRRFIILSLKEELTGADGTIAFFKLQGNLMLRPYERNNLTKDASVGLDPESSIEFSLGCIVKTKKKFHALLKQK